MCVNIKAKQVNMITKNKYVQGIKVRYSEMDFNLTLKPSALLNFLQDLASINAEELGFGYSFVSSHNLGWFLLKYRIEFDEYPSGVYDLQIKTEPRGYAKLFAYRDFEIYNSDKLLGRAASIWSLVDLNTHALQPVGAVLDNINMPPYQKREADLNFEKIRPLSKVDIQKIFEIRFDDIDVNQHVNNCNYIIWALEPLAYEFRASKKIKTLDIMFKKEIKYGHKITSQIEFINENETNHILKCAETSEDLCSLHILWS